MHLMSHKTCTLGLFTFVQLVATRVSLVSTTQSSSHETTSVAAVKSLRQECLAFPPTQVTFTQSLTSVTAAYVIYKDCTILTIRAENRTDGTQTMDASRQKVEFVRRFPQVDSLDLSGNNIVAIASSEGTVLSTLDLSDNGIQDLSTFSIPSTVTTLNLDNNELSTILPRALPASVTSLSIRKNRFTSLANVSVPTYTTHVDLSGNVIPHVTTWPLPRPLQTFACRNCAIESITGLAFPSTLNVSTFDVRGSTVQVFEVANSSVPVLENIRDLLVPTVRGPCRDPHAVAHVTHDRRTTLCVLPDAYFDDKYRLATTQGHVRSDDDPINDDETESNALTNWMLLAMLSLAAMVSCMIGAIIFIIYRRRQQVRDDELRQAETFALNPTPPSVSSKATKYVPSQCSGLSHTEQTDSVPEAGNRDSSLAVLVQDVRLEHELVQCRLLQNEVVRGHLVAKGGYGAVYLATFQNETVVVKQLLPERARERRWLSSFIEEIRLCLTLQHPKIVRFIGVTWSTILDISMVMEYLPQGDLSSLLERQRERERLDGRARDGYTWFATDGPIKCKSLLALDIAEALVYLHSFERPIIHRDLKPKNVLLSASWEAKVTDFGTSRALEEDDQTLTAEIGTVAWIAPEILRGEHYSEKADVYSFGVLLTELDTGCRPYAQGILPGETRHDRILSNTRIAVLVSAGSLRPHVHDDCPQSVAHLVDKCLAYDPVDRPSALQLHYELRNLEVERDERVALSCSASCLE